MKEALAALQAIKIFGCHDTVLNLYTDSTTLAWYVKHWGGSLPSVEQGHKHVVPTLPAEQHHTTAALCAFGTKSGRPAVEAAAPPGVGGLPPPHHHGCTAQVAPTVELHHRVNWMATEGNSQCSHWVSPDQDWLSQNLVKICSGGSIPLPSHSPHPVQVGRVSP